MASETIEKLREKLKGSGPRAPIQTSAIPTSAVSKTQWPEPDLSEDGKARLKITRWYDTIRVDRSRADEALNYYRICIENGMQHVTAVGNLTILVQETPGLMTLYGGVHVDCAQIRKHLEEMHGIELARRTKFYMYDPKAAQELGNGIKITEAKTWAQTDEHVADLALLIRRFANAENQLGNIMSGFQSRAIMLTKIVTIREAGLQEVWVDPTKETFNE